VQNNWDERYRRGDHGNAEPHPLVVRAAQLSAPGCALDVACGTGRHALWLAERGWQVTAVDRSQVALELLQAGAKERGLVVEAIVADLESGEFAIEPQAYDLIVVTCYLQRNLFPALRAGVKPGGIIVAVIAMLDDDPQVKPMNPAFLLAPGELHAQFPAWDLLHEAESKIAGKRAMAEIIARRPL
jgi:tellurite methyltransferase